LYFIAIATEKEKQMDNIITAKQCRESFMSDYIDKAIEISKICYSEAKKGNNSVIVDLGLERYYIMELLEENGYKVESIPNGNQFKIKWR
jgi:hypothetical protein